MAESVAQIIVVDIITGAVEGADGPFLVHLRATDRWWIRAINRLKAERSHSRGYDIAMDDVHRPLGIGAKRCVDCEEAPFAERCAQPPDHLDRIGDVFEDVETDGHVDPTGKRLTL